ncbi:hypothetical protein [Nostoc sp. C110]
MYSIPAKVYQSVEGTLTHSVVLVNRSGFAAIGTWGDRSSA